MTAENDAIKSALYFSTVAGLSTAIGAAVVFCIPERNGQRQVPPGAMAFSLALAGSVMVTVSVISILPECFSDNSMSVTGDDDYHLLPLGWKFIMRIICFVIGTGLYFCLSWCLTEPEQLLQDNIKTLVGFKTHAPKHKDLEMEDLSLLHETMRNRNTSSISRNNSASSLSLQRDSFEEKSNEKMTNPSALDNKTDPISWTQGRDLKNAQNQKAWRYELLS